MSRDFFISVSFDQYFVSSRLSCIILCNFFVEFCKFFLLLQPVILIWIHCFGSVSRHFAASGSMLLINTNPDISIFYDSIFKKSKKVIYVFFGTFFKDIQSSGDALAQQGTLQTWNFLIFLFWRQFWRYPDSGPYPDPYPLIHLNPYPVRLRVWNIGFRTHERFFATCACALVEITSGSEVQSENFLLRILILISRIKNLELWIKIPGIESAFFLLSANC